VVNTQYLESGSRLLPVPVYDRSKSELALVPDKLLPPDLLLDRVVFKIPYLVVGAATEQIPRLVQLF
jgi:hypothetical protein